MCNDKLDAYLQARCLWSIYRDASIQDVLRRKWLFLFCHVLVTLHCNCQPAQNALVVPSRDVNERQLKQQFDGLGLCLGHATGLG